MHLFYLLSEELNKCIRQTIALLNLLTLRGLSWNVDAIITRLISFVNCYKKISHKYIDNRLIPNLRD